MANLKQTVKFQESIWGKVQVGAKGRMPKIDSVDPSLWVRYVCTLRIQRWYMYGNDIRSCGTKILLDDIHTSLGVSDINFKSRH